MKLIITDIEKFNVPIEGEYKVIKPNETAVCFKLKNRLPIFAQKKTDLLYCVVTNRLSFKMNW